ncbi:MAG: ATP-dependent helicase [Bacillota bacterium]
MIELRKGQDEVAEYREGYMAVPAVPGAGKTTVLAYLAADLIAENYIDNGKLLIVTYMNSAVANFRNRIGNYLEERGHSRNRGYEVRTLHSLALNILKEKPEYMLINDEFRIIDPQKKGRIIGEVIDGWLSANPERSLKHFSYHPAEGGYNRAEERWKEKDFYKFIKSMISYLKLYNFNRSKAISLKNSLKNDSYLSWALEIFANYDRLLHQEGMLDFDDLIIQALNLLKNDEKLQKRLSNKFTYVFEDEAQDSNHVLSEILELLAGKNGNLVRVGDSNQSIMGTFTSADPEVFRSFIERDRVIRKNILYSSRSTIDIINLANHLVNWVVEKHPIDKCKESLEEKYIKEVPPDDPAPNPVTENYTIGHKTFSDSEKEIKNIAEQAVKHANSNPNNTIGILVPSNYTVDDLAGYLSKFDVEYEKVSNRYEDKLTIIKNYRSLINFLAEPHNNNYFSVCLNEVFLPKYFDDIEINNSIKNIFSNFNLEDIFYPIGGEEKTKNELLDIIPDKNRNKFNEMLEEISYYLDASIKLPPDELILFLAERMELKEEELAIVQNMALNIKSELDLHPNWKLKDIADEFTRLEESFERFAKKIYERKGFEPKKGIITITTVHKAKGMEWDTVFLTYLTDDYYPSTIDDKFRGEYYYLKDEYSNPKAMAKAELEYYLNEEKSKNPKNIARIEHISERLRLLYVGITRAEKNLFLSAHKEIIYDNGSKKVNEALPYRVLKKFINREKAKYEDQ